MGCFLVLLNCPQSEEEQKQDVSFSHGRPVGSSNYMMIKKYAMKKIKLSLVLLMIVAFSACTLKGNITLNGKDIIIDQLKGLKSHKDLTPINDTSNQAQLTGDFRYDYLLK